MTIYDKDYIPHKNKKQKRYKGKDLSRNPGRFHMSKSQILPS